MSFCLFVKRLVVRDEGNVPSRCDREINEITGTKSWQSTIHVLLHKLLIDWDWSNPQTIRLGESRVKPIGVQGAGSADRTRHLEKTVHRKKQFNTSLGSSAKKMEAVGVIVGRKINRINDYVAVNDDRFG